MWQAVSVVTQNFVVTTLVLLGQRREPAPDVEELCGTYRRTNLRALQLLAESPQHGLGKAAEHRYSQPRRLNQR